MRFTSLIVELIRARPRFVFWVLVSLLAFFWFALPALLYAAPPGDVASVLAIGRDYSVSPGGGPPLAYWLADIAFRLAGGHILGVYLLSQLCFVVAFWALFQLGRATAGPQQGMLAVLLSVTILALSYPSIEFGPQVLACPLWALVVFHGWRVIGEGRRSAWFALSIVSGLLLLTTHAAPLLLASFVAFALATGRGRRAFASSDPVFAALVVIALAAPYLVWLLRSGAVAMPAWPTPDQAVTRLTVWGELLGALLLNLIGIILLGVINWSRFDRNIEKAPVIYRAPIDPLARAYVYFFSLVPPLLLTLVAAAFGNEQSFTHYGAVLLPTGLAVILAASDRVYLRHQKALRAVWLALILAPAAALVLAVLIQPWTGGSEWKTSLPASSIGRFFGKSYETRVGRPLPAVAGDMDIAEVIGFAAPSRPRVIGTSPVQQASPQAVAYDVAKEGGLVVWRARDTAGAPPADIKARFPGLVAEVPQTFDRRINGQLPPLRIGWGIIRPQTPPPAK